jgi:hypothetical protein
MPGPGMSYGRPPGPGPVPGMGGYPPRGPAGYPPQQQPRPNW